MSKDSIRNIVIVGGGTAGWLTAAIVAKDHCTEKGNGIKVTVVESKKISILGVGEGTWPSIRNTVRRIGISETEILKKCQASFKQGTRFVGWLDGSSIDQYYHPFELPPSEDLVDPYRLWKSGSLESPFASVVSSQVEICSRNLAPKTRQSPEFEGVANYAYHIDAVAFAALLREHCVEKLGVRHIYDEVLEAEYEDNDFISSLNVKSGNQVFGDVFIDCTGLRAQLIGKHKNSLVRDLSDVLFNDSAIASQVSYASDDETIRSQTDSTAESAGWIWDIGLRHRRGVGYVYSSRHLEDESAATALVKYIERTSKQYVKKDDFRLIKFKPHYRPKAWIGNCIAVGMSQGFVEPLEASAIVMIELAANYISKVLPPCKSAIKYVSDDFNKRFQYRWERLAEFLKLHYLLSRRSEQYWTENRRRESIPERLNVLLARWKYNSPAREDFPDALEIFTASSYAYILYGMKFQTYERSYVRANELPETLLSVKSQLMDRKHRIPYILPTNRDLLNYLCV